MLFTIGSRVTLKRTGDTGVVSAILGEDLIEIRLDNGLGHIPVPSDALAYFNHTPPENTEKGARFIPGKKKVDPEFEPINLDLGYTILKPWGIQLAFDPALRADGETERYRVYLINDTNQVIIYQIKLRLNGQEIWSRMGQLGGADFRELGDLKHAELNEQPAFEAEVRQQLPQGTGAPNRQLLKIKPKQFFAKQKTAPLLNRKVHHYLLFPSLSEEKAPKKGESLALLTQRNAGKKKQGANLRQFTPTPRPDQVAAFETTLDLHLNKLGEDKAKIPPKQYLDTQLRQFHAYMIQAIQLGVERVFIIHGIGEGKLRKVIHQELAKMNTVASYRNEFHPNYGHGATEVIFKRN